MLIRVGAAGRERRTAEQARRLRELAEGIASAADSAAAQALDFAFMAELVEAAGTSSSG